MDIIYVIFLLCVISYVYASDGATGLVKQEKSSAPAVMGDPTTNTFKWIAFRQAVQSGNMSSAHSVLMSGDKGLKRYCVMHLLSLGSVKLVELINGTNNNQKPWILQIILVCANQSLLNTVFAELKPSNDLLSRVAKSADLVCKSQRFTYLLGKITDKEEQERAVRQGVEVLFKAKKTECLDPLLDALSEESFMDTNLKNIAIRQAFMSASIQPDNIALIVKRFFGHPAVTAEDYFYDLCWIYYFGGQAKELFYWLLARADHQDLVVTRENDQFSIKDPEFQEAVNYALQTVGDEVRSGITHRRRVATMQEALESDIPIVILGLIGGYIEW